MPQPHVILVGATYTPSQLISQVFTINKNIPDYRSLYTVCGGCTNGHTINRVANKWFCYQPAVPVLEGTVGLYQYLIDGCNFKWKWRRVSAKTGLYLEYVEQPNGGSNKYSVPTDKESEMSTTTPYAQSNPVHSSIFLSKTSALTQAVETPTTTQVNRVNHSIFKAVTIQLATSVFLNSIHESNVTDLSLVRHTTQLHTSEPTEPETISDIFTKYIALVITAAVVVLAVVGIGIWYVKR